MANRNRCVFVTGSSRGIGFGIAKAFAMQGDTVILNGRIDNAQLSNAVEEMLTINPNVLGICTDLSDYESAQKTFAQIVATYGPVEVLINNAGAAHYGLFTDMTPQEWQKVLADNLLTAINTSHLAIPSMVRAKSGCIINITSIWGITGASCEAIYATSKAALCAFTKSLAKELGPSGVRVNAIACGAFDTRMNDHLTLNEKAEFIENIPLGRFGHPDEAGELAVFLASPAARYLTSQIITLDGGLI